MPQRLYLPFGQYRVPFSFRGSLKPPETLDEHMEKFEMVRRGVIDFASYQISKSLRYAMAFLKIGATAPEKAPATKSEESQRFEEEMQRLYSIPATDPNVIFEQ